MSTFAIEVPSDPEEMVAFQELMDSVHDSNTQEIDSIQKQLDVTEKFAMSIWYLRTRSRHTPELEQQLIEMSHRGEMAPNMNEWPLTREEK